MPHFSLARLFFSFLLFVCLSISQRSPPTKCANLLFSCLAVNSKFSITDRRAAPALLSSAGSPRPLDCPLTNRFIYVFQSLCISPLSTLLLLASLPWPTLVLSSLCIATDIDSNLMIVKSIEFRRGRPRVAQSYDLFAARGARHSGPRSSGHSGESSLQVAARVRVVLSKLVPLPPAVMMTQQRPPDEQQ